MKLHNGPVRMSRTPGGKATYGECGHGKAGARGMGSRYSGGKNTANKLSWSDPPRQKAKDGSKTMSPKTQPDNYNKLSRNPSGASNSPVRPTTSMGGDW